MFNYGYKKRGTSVENEVDQLFECFLLAANENRRLLRMGDFNYPDINWNLLRSDNAGQILKVSIGLLS